MLYSYDLLVVILSKTKDLIMTKGMGCFTTVQHDKDMKTVNYKNK